MPIQTDTAISFDFIDGAGLKGARHLVAGVEQAFFDMRHYTGATTFGDTGVTISAISETGDAGLVGMGLGDGVGVRGSDDSTQQRRSIEGGEALVFALSDLPAGALGTSIDLTLSNVSGSGDVELTFLSGGVPGSVVTATPVDGMISVTDTGGGFDTVQIASTGTLGFEVQTFTFVAGDAGENRAPVANDDSYFATEGTPLDIAADGVLGNDSDPDGDALSVSLVTGVSSGALTLDADGGFRYTPTADFVGTDSFTYSVQDPDGLVAEATVTIEVEAAPAGVVARLDFLDDANGTRNLDYFENGVLIDSDAQRTFETVRVSDAGGIRLTAETGDLSLRGAGLGVRSLEGDDAAERTTLDDDETILAELLEADAFDLTLGIHDSRGAGAVSLEFYSNGALVETATAQISGDEVAHTLAGGQSYDAVRIGMTGDLQIELAHLEYATGVEPVDLAPAPVLPSEITLALGPAVQLTAPSNFNNFAAPVAIGAHLYVIDQQGGISLWDGTEVRPVLDGTDLPAGITPTGREAYLNIAGSGDTAYVAFTSSSLPDGMIAAQLPDDPAVNTSEQLYQVIVGYTRAEDGSLSAPAPIAAFERAASGHAGGGMLELPDGTILFATGDGLSQDYNGLTYAQDAGEHVGSLLIIDPTTGEVETAAVGLRNVQRLAYVGEDEVGFADIGWTVSEEINRIDVADLVDLSEVENFGWGIADDGLAREGSFYVNDGPSDASAAIGVAPLGEPGFIQPYAEVGRIDPEVFFAGSGPVAGASLGPDIGLVFGDLVSGALYATASEGDDVLADVFEVALVDMLGNPVVMDDLIPDVRRAELRFFNFPDGEAGLFLERQGTAYSLSIVGDDLFV